MSSSNKNKIVAVIDIGSSAVKMRISQKQGDEIIDLDFLEYPISLGHGAYTEQKISIEIIREIIQILTGFCKLMDEYGVNQYRVVASSALREAKNRSYVLDQIKIHNNLSVEVLEDIENKSLIFSEALMAFSNNPIPGFSNALIAYVGEGSIGIAQYEADKITMTQNMKIGSMKLSDMFSNVSLETDRYDDILHEYLKLISEMLKKHLKDSKLKNLVIIGNEIFIISKILNIKPKNGYIKISKSRLRELYKKLCQKTSALICAEYSITDEQCDLLMTSLAIYLCLFDLVFTEDFYSPVLGFWDSIISSLFSTKKEQEKNTAIHEHTLACAKAIAEKYECDKSHYTKVNEIAVKIFNKLKKLHGLSVKERQYLSLACILEECGKYINVKNFEYSTYQIIRHSSFVGLSKKDKQLIALITRYRSLKSSEDMDEKVLSLTECERLTIAKLNAVFRLAEALDKSHRQIIGEIMITLSENKLAITVYAEDDLLLENWAFKESAAFFEDIFGIKAELVKRIQS